MVYLSWRSMAHPLVGLEVDRGGEHWVVGISSWMVDQLVAFGFWDVEMFRMICVAKETSLTESIGSPACSKGTT